MTSGNSAMPMSQRWTEMVRAEHEQADRVRGEFREDDFWKSFSHRFAPHQAHQTGKDPIDPGLEVLFSMLKPSDTLIDVGAGGGRVALPAAKRVRKVVAVEPSEGMRETMAGAAREWGVKNLEVVAAKWEEASIDPGDVVICSHVLYTVREPLPFVQKLESSARRLVVVVMFEQVAAAHYFPLWPPVHGEQRLHLPCLPEFKLLLDEMGTRYKLDPLPLRPPRGFDSVEQAVTESMARLFVRPGSPKATTLERTVRESLVTQPDGSVLFKWAAPQKAWLVTWPGKAE